MPVKLPDALDTAVNKVNTVPDIMGFTICSAEDRTSNITINKIISATGKCYEEIKQDDVVELCLGQGGSFILRVQEKLLWRSEIGAETS